MKNKTFYARSEIYLIGSNVTIFENRKEVLNHSTLVGSGGEEESSEKRYYLKWAMSTLHPGREKKGRDEAARKRWKEVDKEVDNEG